MRILKLLILDDHKLFSDGLELMLQTWQPSCSISRHSKVRPLLNDGLDLEEYDLAIVDLQLSDLSGFHFLEAILSRDIKLRTIVVSGTNQVKEIERAFRLGATGFISKDCAKTEMIQGIEAALDGERFLPKKWDGLIDWQRVNSTVSISEKKPLSQRQLEVLSMMSDGLQNKQIAIVLGISPATVKFHIDSLFKLFEVNNRTACVKIATEKELI